MSPNEVQAAPSLDIDALISCVRGSMRFEGVQVDPDIYGACLTEQPRVKEGSDGIVRVWLRNGTGSFDVERSYQVVEVAYLATHNLVILATPSEAFVLDASALQAEVSHGDE